tara:strand:- start:1973 stop:3460 length:1488 start_codon:yes stop_codon:yes gene_type:complete
MADFKALLEEQKRTSDILSKQRNPLDARTGAGRALLNQQKQTNEKLDRIADATDTSLVEDNLSNLAEIINARLLQSKNEKFQEDQGITETDNLLSSQPNKGTGLYDIQKEYNDASLPLLQKMANSMSGGGGEDDDGSGKDPKKTGRIGKIFASMRSIFGKKENDNKDNRQGSKFKLSNLLMPIKSIPKMLLGGILKIGEMFKSAIGGFVKGIIGAFSGLFNKFFGGFKFLLTTAATVLALGFLIKFLRNTDFTKLEERLTEGFRFLGEDLVPMVKKVFKELVAVIKEFVSDIRDVLDFFGIFERDKREAYIREEAETLAERADDLAKRDIPKEITDKQKKIAELEEKLAANPKSARFKSQLESERLKLQNLIRNKQLVGLLNPDGTLKAGAEDYFAKEFVETEDKKLLDQENKKLEIEKQNKQKQNSPVLEHLQREAEMKERELTLQSNAQGNSGDTVLAQAKTVNNQQDNTYVAYGKPNFHDTALSHMSTSQYT